MHKSCLLAFLSLLCLPALAQDLVILNARIIDGTGQVIDDGTVSIRDGRIAAVGAQVPMPDDADSIDVGGMTVMPGMINAHWHLYAGTAASDEDELKRFTDTVVTAVLENILQRGVTTIMSQGDHYPAIIELRNRLDQGELRGPRLLVAGPVITSPDDWPTQLCTGNEACNNSKNAVFNAEDDATTRVGQLADSGVDAIKFVYDDIIAPDARIDDGIVRAMADEAEAHGLPLFVHMSSSEVPASTLVQLGVDGFVHSTMDIDGALDDLLQRHIPVITTATATLSVADRVRIREPGFVPAGAEYMQTALDNIRTLWRQDIPVVFGTDSVAGPEGLNSGFLRLTASGEGAFVAEISALSRVLSNEQIIASMTRNAALMLRMGDEIGTLEPGKLADIVVIDGDPLGNIADLEKVRLVVRSGRVVVDRR